MWSDRRLAVLGGASLLLNVFLVGIVVGHVVATFRHPGPERHGGGRPIQAVRLETLSPSERRQFTATMSAHRPAIRAARDDSHAQRLVTETDISAPSFDRAKVAADFEALRKSNQIVSESVDAGLVDALADLPQEARAALIAHGRRGNHPRP